MAVQDVPEGPQLNDLFAEGHGEDALRESEARYRLLFQHMLDGFAYCRMLFDEGGRPVDFVYLDVNASFERLTGLRDVVGKKVTEVIPAIRESHPELFETYGRVARTGKPERFEVDFRPLDRWLSVSVYSPRPDHFVAVFDDITERKRAEEALRESSRLKDEFLSMASHELRTPLTSLRLHAENLGRSLRKTQRADEHVERKLSVMEAQFDRMDALVQKLLDVSRITAHKLVLELATFDLGALAREVVERFENQAESAGVELRLRARTVVGRWDCMRIDQVITNLLSNALKYGDGKPVAVTVDERDGAALLVVQDHGIGIPPESQGRIFERFERAANTRPVSGLGLGLWIAKQMVEAHRGTITVESAPGAGARFAVTLPRGGP